MKRGQKPYLVAPCIQCRHYFYVNLTKGQKIKKCLRCGKRNSILKDRGIIVKGMTAALEKVKEMQHDLFLKVEGRRPDYALGSNEGFTVASESFRTMEAGKECKDLEGLEGRFKSLLETIVQEYSTFPRYVLDLLTREHGIPASELDMLVKRFVRKGVLKLIGGYLTVNNSDFPLSRGEQ